MTQQERDDNRTVLEGVPTPTPVTGTPANDSNGMPVKDCTGIQEETSGQLVAEDGSAVVPNSEAEIVVEGLESASFAFAEAEDEDEEEEIDIVFE